MSALPRVTIWNEFQHEKNNEQIGKLYPDGMHGAIAKYLRKQGYEVQTATLDEPEHGLTDEVLNRIILLPRLEMLSIRECPISGRFLVDLEKVSPTQLPRLQTLVITKAFLPDEAIGVLPRFAGSLTRLDLSGIMLSPVMTRSIGELHQLRSLTLAGCSLENQAIRPLTTLKNLQTLDLSGNFGLTDEAARMLDALPELETINTRDTSITRPDDV